jgi:shikimate kinase
LSGAKIGIFFYYQNFLSNLLKNFIMIITLMGYMGSGKSIVSNELSSKMRFKNIDLDNEISSEIGLSIPEIFQKKGELFFRKKEKEILERVLDSQKDVVLSLGGGTPCYYNNIDLINKRSVSVYLVANVNTLVKNLLHEREKRPLIAGIKEEELPNFIGQHLMERNQYYSKAKVAVMVNNWDLDRIVSDILTEIEKLGYEIKNKN